MQNKLHFLHIQSFFVQEIHLKSGKVLKKESSCGIEEEEETIIPNKSDTTIVNKWTEFQKDQLQLTKLPPFLERLYLEKIAISLNYDFLDKLKNICVENILLQYINNIPTCVEFESCLNQGSFLRVGWFLLEVIVAAGGIQPHVTRVWYHHRCRFF